MRLNLPSGTAWLDKQPRVPEMLPTGNVKVVLIKFNDYQCPSCRMTWQLYRDVIAKWEAERPGCSRSRPVISRWKSSAVPEGRTGARANRPWRFALRKPETAGRRWKRGSTSTSPS